MRNFSNLEKKIGLNFKNRKLLIQAFCHRSYLNENPELKIDNNERLEFLGDAVLELVVSEYLYKNFSKKSEGELTSLRALLVNSDTLYEISKNLGLDKFLLLSKGESKNNEKAKRYILADSFEALIGAIYLDRGYKKCQTFIKKHLISKLNHLIKVGKIKKAKSYLQEKAQEKLRITPEYRVLKEWGPDHDKHFKVGVYLENKLIGKGEGSSKKEAEEKAAEDALKNKNW